MAVVINRTAEGKNVPFSTLTHTFSGNNRTVNAEKRTVSSATTRLKPSTAGFFKHHSYNQSFINQIKILNHGKARLLPGKTG
jgi:hypothetical protein